MVRPVMPVGGDDDVVVGSGDYLRDRGYGDPDESRAKFLLANEIAVAVEIGKLSQAEAARLTDLKQPDISRIVNGNVKDYSVWRLMTTLQALGYDLAIEIRRATNGKGRIAWNDGNDGLDGDVI